MTLERLRYAAAGPIESLAGQTSLRVPPDISERDECASADDLLAEIGTVLLAKGTESLFVGNEKSTRPDWRSRMFMQAIRGIPVINGFVGIEYDSSTLAITKIVARFVPDFGLPEAPKLTAREAEELLPAGWSVGPHVAPDSNDSPLGTQLAYYLPGKDQPASLAWAIPVSIEGMPEWGYVNAVTGLVLGHVPSHVHERIAVVSRPCEITR